jgi:hypothetical protein
MGINMIGEDSISEFSIGETPETSASPGLVLQCQFDVEATIDSRFTIQPRYEVFLTLDPSP